ncbi:hypothetical protein Rleg4DRAFT_4958 [Rhizobium leguminosarum bv. trifolii WSM2297]|uniref:Peptidase propeptide domain-containing protein n=1 Tax=Rhizobium leguminosarum bv. trifolii WSM2297 TaxID=754762 RepID=J0WDE2_RHILT|nr:hypothetical protein [Rhizobium leguminosarum]EJC83218.1 hypothetical protein Rleg4DRAFT_4958 [Rhizobium leguminosarum bv. trifolii WSM2297]
MRKIAISLLLGFSTIVSAWPVQSQETRREYRRMNWNESLPETIRTYKGKRLTVVSYRTAEFSETGSHPRQGSEEHVKAIRDAARANKSLVAQLKQKKLSPNDIEWAVKARNGNLIIYVK